MKRQLGFLTPKAQRKQYISRAGLDDDVLKSFDPDMGTGVRPETVTPKSEFSSDWVVGSKIVIDG